MKSKMFVLLLSVLLISLLSSSVFSEDTDPRIGLYYRLSPKDDTVSINVFIQSASNVAGCQVWLTYNPAVLDYVDEVFEEGDYFPANAFYGQRQLESLSDTETRLRFAVASAPIENKNSGIIATLTFKVLNAEENLSLSLVDGDLNKGTGTLFSDATGSLLLPGVFEPDDHSNIPAGAKSLLEELIGLDNPFAAVAGVAPPVDILNAADVANLRANWEDIAKGVEDYEGNERLDANKDGFVNERDLQLVEFALKLDLTEDGLLNREDAEAMAEAFQFVGPVGPKYDIDGDGSPRTLEDQSIVFRAVQHIDPSGGNSLHTSDGWRLPEGLISEVAYGGNSTYFVFTPGFAESDTAVGYKNTITLDIPGTYDFDKTKTVQELLDDIEAMSDSPAYFMFPLVPPDANELAEAISEIEASEDETLGSVFKAYGSYLREVGTFAAGILWSPVGWVLGGIEVEKEGLNFYSTLFQYLSGYFSDSDNGYLSQRFSELADNDDGKIILETFLKAYENPQVTIENYTGSFRGGITYLLMIPKRLSSIDTTWTQQFIHKEILIEFYDAEPDETGAWGMTLSVDDEDPIDIEPMLGFASKPDVSNALEDLINFFKSADVNNPAALQNVPDQTRTQIIKSLEVLQTVIEDSGKYLLITDLVSNPRTGKHQIYAGQKAPSQFEYNWDLEETFRQGNSGASAPSAQPMSLADYPPFQQLPPEIQAYLLQHFEGTANPKPLNLEAREIPLETSLLPNYPNPFNPETWIPYQLATAADVTLKIYDIQGRVVRDLDLGHQRAGVYHSRARAVYWDGSNAVGEPVASGVYFYTLTADDFTATRKLLIRK